MSILDMLRCIILAMSELTVGTNPRRTKTANGAKRTLSRNRRKGAALSPALSPKGEGDLPESQESVKVAAGGSLAE